MIPWFPGGHCDPWNLVECAMALDVAGLHDEAMAAYRWLVDRRSCRRARGTTTTPPTARVEEDKLDTNVCAYVATGALHHWLCTSSRDDAEALWPAVERALTFVLAQRRDDGLVLWAIEADGTPGPGTMRLLTGSSSIAHALRCGARLGAVLGHRRPRWIHAAEHMLTAIVERPDAFEPKQRWAMDWYYPVLMRRARRECRQGPPRRRLGDVRDGRIRRALRERRAVGHRLGDRRVCHRLGRPSATPTRPATCCAGPAPTGATTASYWTGIVYPDPGPRMPVVFPFDEHTSYTAAAVILAADAIGGTAPASRIFAPTPEY